MGWDIIEKWLMQRRGLLFCFAIVYVALAFDVKAEEFNKFN